MHKCTQITTYAWVSRVEKSCIYRVNSVHKKGQHQFYAHKLSVLFIYQYFVLCFALCTKNKVFIGLPIIRSCFLLIKSYLYIFFFKNISNLLPDTQTITYTWYICIFFSYILYKLIFYKTFKNKIYKYTTYKQFLEYQRKDPVYSSVYFLYYNYGASQHCSCMNPNLRYIFLLTSKKYTVN